ncbi:MAG: RPA12/RPB9/RPC11 RNA polymerase family protein [Nitrososphaerota archaeon]|nr:RPA12/RPB9/RPC11 RNA polymerase family protein [Nitrososphaerota archaeon]
MTPKIVKKELVFTCPKCNKRVKSDSTIKEAPDESLRSDNVIVLPPVKTTVGECSRCGKGPIAKLIMQTRSADEPSTIFYRCENCLFTWRDYG